MKLVLPSALLGIALSAGAAAAHISVTTGPAAADATAEIGFGISHGCGTSDTLAVSIEIPAGITGVRALRSDFGKPVLTKDGGGEVTAVTWTKPLAELQDEDVGYYTLRIRARAPAAPFTRLFFRIHQTCRSASGEETVVDWVALPGEEGEPAAALVILPRRYPGWNQLTVPAGTPTIVAADLPRWFGDAQIVWKDTAAYSPNPTITTLIEATPGVSALTTLAPGDTVWVKY